MNELWDLYDGNRRKTDLKIRRGERIPQGLYHLSVSAWILNSQGEYLLSQRHPSKQYPYLWECTGGCVIAGENSLYGAIREVKEELGIALDSNNAQMIYQTRRDNTQDFYDVWLFRADIDITELNLQETEVIKARWADLKTLREMFDAKKLHPLIDLMFITYLNKFSL